MYLSCASFMHKQNTKFKTIFDCHWRLFFCVMKRHQYQVQFPAVDVLIKLIEVDYKNLNYIKVEPLIPMYTIKTTHEFRHPDTFEVL